MGLYNKSDRDRFAEVGRIEKRVDTLEKNNGQPLDAYTKGEADALFLNKTTGGDIGADISINSNLVWHEGNRKLSHVAQIADPSTATAEDVANRLNQLIQALTDSGIMA
jgi:hypothetical protein